MKKWPHFWHPNSFLFPPDCQIKSPIFSPWFLTVFFWPTGPSPSSQDTQNLFLYFISQQSQVTTTDNCCQNHHHKKSAKMADNLKYLRCLCQCPSFKRKSSEEEELAYRSKKIDQMIKQDQRKMQQEVKLLLLGMNYVYLDFFLSRKFQIFFAIMQK